MFSILLSLSYTHNYKKISNEGGMQGREELCKAIHRTLSLYESLFIKHTLYTPPPPPPECELCLEVDATKVTLTTDDNIIIIMVCIRLSG